MQEPAETEQEIARRLAAQYKNDNFLKTVARIGRKNRYLGSYLLFEREILKQPFTSNYHGEISDRLDKNKNKKHLIIGPRNSRKTTAITIGKSIHRNLQRKNMTTLIFGETHHNALERLRTIKTICECNEDFIDAFGVMGYTGGPTKWSEEELYFMSRDNPNIINPTYSAAGLDSAVVGGHYDLIIADDVVSNKNTQTEEQMRKTKEIFDSLFYLLNPGGEFWVIGTFWDQYDLYNTIMQDYFNDFMFYVKGGFGEPGKLDGEPILPMEPFNLTREHLLSQLNRPGNRRMALMQLFSYCTDEEKQPFKEAQKKTWNPVTRMGPYGEPIPDRNFLNVCITVDPAASTSDTACDTGIVVAGMDEKSNLWELENMSGKYEPMQTINTIFDLCTKWQPNTIGIESASFYNYIKTWLDIEMRKRNHFLPIQPLEGWKSKSKHERILGLQPRWEQGALILREDSKDLMDQFYRYPKGKRIDGLDAFAYQEEIQFCPMKKQENGVYYDKKKYPDLTDVERHLWSRRDKKLIERKAMEEDSRREALSTPFE